MGKRRQTRPQDEYEVIFTKYVTLRSGRRIYAASYGLKYGDHNPSGRLPSTQGHSAMMQAPPIPP